MQLNRVSGCDLSLLFSLSKLLAQEFPRRTVDSCFHEFPTTFTPCGIFPLRLPPLGSSETFIFAPPPPPVQSQFKRTVILWISSCLPAWNREKKSKGHLRSSTYDEYLLRNLSLCHFVFNEEIARCYQPLYYVTASSVGVGRATQKRTTMTYDMKPYSAEYSNSNGSQN